jgi:hypothetical protein
MLASEERAGFLRKLQVGVGFVEMHKTPLFSVPWTKHTRRLFRLFCPPWCQIWSLHLLFANCFSNPHFMLNGLWFIYFGLRPLRLPMWMPWCGGESSRESWNCARCVCMYVCVCMYMYVYVCMYMCVCVCLCVCVCVCVCIYIYVCVYVRVCMYICVHMWWGA